MILFYSIPYSPSPEQAALIAMAVGLARGAAVPVAVEERTA
jgi:hypothetical protein